MKLRSKLLLSATCLLTISVAATATSAYAWFISNRQASVAINNAHVKTNATNLKIAGVALGQEDKETTVSFSTTAVAGNLTTETSSITATDISGDGVNFYKPKLAPDFGVGNNPTYNASSIAKVTNSASAKYYHQFKLQFSQDNADVNTGVFLSNESSVLLTTAITVDQESKRNAGIALCARVAFLNESGTNLLLYWAPNRASNNANKSYIKTTSNSTVSIKDGDTSAVLETLGSDGSTTTKGKVLYGAPEDINDATADKSTKKERLLTLNGTTPQTITVRIWFEGMDSACNSNNIAQTIEALLKFNGVNMDI